MTNVNVPLGDNPSETATLLLAAAEELGLDQTVVGYDSYEGFVVPEEVAKQAEKDKKPVKKAAAKKTAKKS
jgi:hypothetical protein